MPAHRSPPYLDPEHIVTDRGGRVRIRAGMTPFHREVELEVEVEVRWAEVMLYSALQCDDRKKEDCDWRGGSEVKC